MHFEAESNEHQDSLSFGRVSDKPIDFAYTATRSLYIIHRVFICHTSFSTSM